MFAEHGPIELLQLAAWSAALAAGIAGIRRRGPIRERLFAMWLCALALGAILRELDAHTLLNPAGPGGFGIRYRIDWWLNPETPPLPRLLGLGAGVSIAAMLIVPFVWVAPKFVKLLAVRDAAWVFLALAALSIIGGYACDDLLGRGRFTAPEHTKAIEELLELAGAIAFAAGAWALLRTPLGPREARADRLLEATPLARLGGRPRRGATLSLPETERRPPD
jgi:hypothetical protein